MPETRFKTSFSAFPVRTAALVFTLMVCSLLPALAQEEPEELDTDRPTQSQGPKVIPRGTVQLESGVQYVRSTEEAGELKVLSGPALLVRVGLLKRVELRVSGKLVDSTFEYNSFLFLNHGQEIATKKMRGFSSPAAGFKAQFRDADGWKPAIGFIGMVTLPVGSKEVRVQHASPQGQLAFEHELTEKLKLLYNLGYSWNADEKHGEEGYTLTLQGKVLEPLQLYAEVFGSKAGEGPAEHQINGGIMWQFLPNFQLDVAAGRQLNASAPDFFVTAGLCARLPR